MKRFLFFISTILISISSFGQIQIWQESFESTDNYTTSPAEFTDGAVDYFTRTDLKNVGSAVSITGIAGSYFFGAQDTDGDGNPATGLTVTFSPVDITGYTNLIFKGLFAEDASSDGNNDWDAGSNVIIQYSIDAGVPMNLISFEASVDATNQTASEDTDFNGTGDGVVLTDALTEFTKNIANTGASIVITVTINNLKNGDEDIAFDNFRLEGTSSAATEEVDWCNLQWPEEITLSLGNSEPVYARVYEEGITNGVGQGTSIEVSIGYSTTNTDPSTWSSWVEATYHADKDNNDEYKANIGANLPEGTYYYASRFRLNGSIFTYGGLNGGTWDGSTNVSGVLTIQNLPVEVSDIATLRAGNTNGTKYTLTSEAILTSQNSDKGQKYIEDNTGAILIYDETGIITTTFDRYDGITGVTGTLALSNGVIQFHPLSDPGSSTTQGNTLAPQEITLDELTSNFEAYESELITIKNLSFDDADGTLSFVNGTKYGVSDGTGTALFRTNFYNVNYIGTVIPGTKHVTSIAIEHDGEIQLTARDASDFLTITGTQDIDSDMQIYSFNNIIHVNIENITNAKISIFEISGRNIYGETTISNKNIIDCNLEIGTYIVKVQTNNKVYTQKVFVQ